MARCEVVCVAETVAVCVDVDVLVADADVDPGSAAVAVVDDVQADDDSAQHAAPAAAMHRYCR